MSWRTAHVRLLGWAPWLPTALVLLALAAPLEALARGGGGEHYTRPSSDDRDGGGGLPAWFINEILFLVIRYPKVMIPLILIGGVAYWLYRRNLHPDATTRRALEQREADRRTRVSQQDVSGWVNALKLKDSAFELPPVLDKTRWLFLELQKAWFQRDMTPVRPFLSDATWQRFNVQLQLLAAQGVRDAITDFEVLDVQLIGLEQSQWFDSIHVRIQARMRDTDVPASFSDAQATEAARKAPQESFTEVWTFVRKPGAQTRVGADLYQGKCPNCGAPYAGGAANRCEYCGAVVNSGNYDWTLSEITQGVEHEHGHRPVGGLAQARQADPALNLEILEDRASLLFWRWIDAQSRGDMKPLTKVASPVALQRLGAEVEELRGRGRRRVFLECAVGSVDAHCFEVDPAGHDLAHVEIRWSARMGVGPANERPPQLPTVPQRFVFTLTRRHGAQTNTANGMSTDRCPQCNAPLTDSAASTCDFCGTQLASGERDWVLVSALPYEAWGVSQDQRHQANVLREAVAVEKAAAPATDAVMDVQERQRLLYMMAAIAAADGEVSGAERKLLKLCSERWGVEWANVEMALGAGPQLFERLVPRGTPEAELFLRNIVEMAMVDGRIDRKERRMLESAAEHLGLRERLDAMISRQ
ncbi:TIM44-like domain-containing protein [Pyxidicoccus fallax]|uniref:TIM44-like domain-containing protein n=1 Tax=Pyxidicoccus fallax TaxID=394095 RepID=A0A848L4M8_9BACT|nr:TIM44-like domain-containing protein [Pyxidicoccus fallax]NMO13619.1 TIM44-like domain-containing protein [Pyxidicoccus fallax]NPC77763.1 TIM44-like domain-containing protein [Pyxidicoccus fallax]